MLNYDTARRWHLVLAVMYTQTHIHTLLAVVKVCTKSSESVHLTSCYNTGGPDFHSRGRDPPPRSTGANGVKPDHVTDAERCIQTHFILKIKNKIIL
jgi:hypothetical protein